MKNHLLFVKWLFFGGERSIFGLNGKISGLSGMPELPEVEKGRAMNGHDAALRGVYSLFNGLTVDGIACVTTMILGALVTKVSPDAHRQRTAAAAKAML